MGVDNSLGYSSNLQNRRGYDEAEDVLRPKGNESLDLGYMKESPLADAVPPRPDCIDEFAWAYMSPAMRWHLSAVSRNDETAGSNFSPESRNELPVDLL
jgi:hypothetical protein